MYEKNNSFGPKCHGCVFFCSATNYNQFLGLWQCGKKIGMFDESLETHPSQTEATH